MRRILAEVHRIDGYPARWPADPAGWLDQPDLVAAWVAVLDESLAGHVTLSRPRPADAAATRFGDGAVMLSRLFVD